MNNKENVINVIKYFGDILAKHLYVAEETIVVVLHQKNGYYPSGLSIRLDMINQIEVVNNAATAQINRYIENIEYVELGIWKEDMLNNIFVIYFIEIGYFIKGLNKQYAYDVFPPKEELNNHFQRMGN